MKRTVLALIAACLCLNGAFAQSTDYRDYFISKESRDLTYSQNQARKRMETATDPRYKDVFLPNIFFMGKLMTVGDIPRLPAGNSELKDKALDFLDLMMMNNWRSMILFSAEGNYKFTPVSAEDIRIEDTVKRVAAADRDAAFRIMTTPPVSDKIAQVREFQVQGITPQVFVTRLREKGVFDNVIIRLAMRFDIIGPMFQYDLNAIAEYADFWDFGNTPLMQDSEVIKKLAGTGFGWVKDVQEAALNALVIPGDTVPTSRFMDTAQAVAKLDEISLHLQYIGNLSEAQRAGREGMTVGYSEKYNWEAHFGASLKAAGFTPQDYFNRLGGMGLGWRPVTMILILGNKYPAVYRNALNLDQAAVTKANSLRDIGQGRSQNWAELERLLGVTDAMR